MENSKRNSVCTGTLPDGRIWLNLEFSNRFRVVETVEEAINQLADASMVSLLGLRRNTALLLALHDTLADNHRLRSVTRIATPLSCRVAHHADDPLLASKAIWASNLPASKGGWRKLSFADYLTYRISYEYESGSADVSNLVTQHPAWPALSFVNRATEVCASILSLILDPRWYIDINAPDRRSKLYSYLGLTDMNMLAAVSRKTTLTKGRNYDKAATVVGWVGGAEMLQDGIIGAWPSPYLQFVSWSYGNGSRGVLRASQKAIDLVRAVWLDAVTSVGDGLFVPKYFFSDKLFLDQWLDHTARL